MTRRLGYFMLGVLISLTLLSFAGCAVSRREHNGRVVWCVGPKETCELVHKNLSR